MKIRLLAACVATMSCRAQPSNAPSFANGPVTLVSPDTGPSALQRSLAAQTPARPEDPTASSRSLEVALDAFDTRAAARRGYIAVDKPLYKPGETIWFRAFDLASASLEGTKQDIVTFELVSPRGSTVVEKRVLVAGGAAANAFDLAGGMPGGEYTIRAVSEGGQMKAERTVIVSSYQPPRIKKKLEFLRKAYGPGDKVSATVELHRATGEALANKQLTGAITIDGEQLPRVPIATDAKGNAFVQFTLPAQMRKGDGLLTILVDDGGVTESVQKRIPITLADLTVAVYPEGGDLVAGLPSRVYFSARNVMDKAADIEGKVTDDRGATVALLRSYHDGMGRFELVPDPARSYKIEITKPSGIAKTYALPAAKDSGCSLQSVDDFTSQRTDVRVAVWCTSDRDVIASGSLRDKRVATQTAHVSAKAPTVLALPAPLGSQGAMRVTVFDDKLSPIAERLVYRNRGSDLKIQITPDKPTYTPRGRVALEIQAKKPDGSPAQADLALSVVDDTVLSFADDKQATLLARLYLEAELPGQKIEEPNFYFGTDAKAPAAIDLVLGTHGWRRFDWKPVLSAPPEKPIEETWAYTGDLIGPKKKPTAIRKDGQKKLADAPVPDVAREEEGEGQVAVAKPKPARERNNRAREEAKAEKADRDDEAEEERPMKKAKKVARRDDDDEAEEDDGERAPRAARGFAAADMEMDDGEQLMVMDATASERSPMGFDNKGFDIGTEADARKVRIRGKDANDEDGIVDPYCCLVEARQFAAPAYEDGYTGPRVDFRETLYWASHVTTDKDGKARVEFSLSDEVTSFRATAEGVGHGALGRGEALVQSKKPVSLAVKLPLEVTAGDHVRLPVTIANETDRPYEAALTATFGKAFKVTGGALPATITLAPNERRSTFYELDIVGDGKEASDGTIAIGVSAANLTDAVEKTIVVAPQGFPQQVSLSGTLSGTIRREVFIGDVLPGTMTGMVTLYPTALATMVEGTEAMIAEPGGCFEQASSTNYPNIMILGYLEENRALEPKVAAKANAALDNGYKLLTGYETKTRGYEWFGGDPGHEALSAYGLMEFADMKKVYGDVDDDMVKRTREWLRGRRDGTGGYKQNARALDSFGKASPEVTNGYITYALTEAGEKDLDVELAEQAKIATTTKDPYLMAMATKSLINAQPTSAATKAAVARLVTMQSKDGAFTGADHSITRSGGEALDIETTSIAAMAMMSYSRETMPNVRAAIEWLNAHRSGTGGYGSTQSTVLALKAMTQYAKEAKTTEAAGTVIVRVDGIEVMRQRFEKGHQGAIEIPLAKYLHTGKNTFEITLESKEPLPYSGLVTWQSKLPASNPSTKVALATKLVTASTKLGEGVRMDVRVTNTTSSGLPMTLARVGLPGGLTFQTWQLKELRDKGIIDFYETRPREVILYFRSLAPNATKDVPLELIASVPGQYVAPPSRAYLYYTAEHKNWVAPTTIRVSP